MTKADEKFNPTLGVTVEVALRHADMGQFAATQERLSRLAVLDHPFVTRVVESKTTDVNDGRSGQVIEWGNFTIDLKIPLDDFLTWLEAVQPKPTKKKGGEA